MNTVTHGARRIALGAVLAFIVLLVAQTCVRIIEAQVPLPPCVLHYVLVGLAGDRVYAEFDNPPNGRCVMTLHSATKTRRG